MATNIIAWTGTQCSSHDDDDVDDDGQGSGDDWSGAFLCFFMSPRSRYTEKLFQKPSTNMTPSPTRSGAS